MKDVWVVIPAYNEEKYIATVVSQIRKEGVVNIVVVDDCSKDTTLDKAVEAGATVLKNKKNRKKAFSLRRGCDYAVKKEAKKLIVMDGDGQHEPKAIKKFLAALKDADLVIGYRKKDEHMPLLYKVGNTFFDVFNAILTGAYIKDTQSGYRAFTADAYKKIRWTGAGYSCESEMTMKALRHGLMILQVPIKTIYNDKYKGTTIWDGFKNAWQMLKVRFS